ncbi:MAG: hypothetical protein AB1756_06485 [Acidobacteriota bacterium]
MIKYAEKEFHPEKDSFEEFHSPFGEEFISIAFAHLSLTFHGLDPAWKTLIAEMYQPFACEDVLSSRSPAALTEIAGRTAISGNADIFVVESSRLSFLKRPARGEISRVEFYEKDGFLFFWAYHFACRYDRKTSKGSLAICTGKDLNRRMIIENFLRVIFSYLALHNGSFFLHSSGVVKDEKAHLFFGHSGAGKTTVATFAKSFPLLSDDQVLVYLRDGKPYASGVPFSGGERFRHEKDAIPFSNINKEFEIAGFYWLVKDKRTFLKEMPLVQAAARLASAIPFIKDSPFPMQEALDIATEIAERARVYALHFTRDDSFLKII